MKKLIKYILFFLIFFFSTFFCLVTTSKALDLNQGKKLFFTNCNVCHKNRGNIIIPEKSLTSEALRTNGIDNLPSIIYQITNGKNGMPAFGGRLTEQEITEIGNYILEQSKK
jgi:cytochrome c6